MPVLRRRDDDPVAAVVQQRLTQLLGGSGGDVDAVVPSPPPSPVGPPSGAAAVADGVAAAPCPAAAPTLPSSPTPTTTAAAAAGVSGFLTAFDPGRRGVRAIAVVAALVVLAAAGAAWWLRPRAEPLPTRVEMSAGAAPTTSGASLVVSVGGRVHHPGLVRLPAGARVADAIDAAGGPLPDTDLAFLNLARKLVDGEMILIGVTPPPGTPAGASVNGGAGGAAAGAGGQPAGPVNLNTATSTELQTLPGVGPVLADRIVAYRTAHNGFGSVDELKKVDGIGSARFEQLRPLVTT